ncbi:MAG: protein TolR [Gammaproteobacteria bacterium]|nr:protein TolR [Gammaproteobacteria bacterium]
MSSRHRRKVMGEINVVPYIDVMLVLLVIFMVTAPMLTQGVKVELPQAESNPVEQSSDEPLVVTVNREGKFFLNIGGEADEPLNAETLSLRVAAMVRLHPQQPVYVRGDAQVPYGRVVEAMALIQQAGVPSVGLLTQPAEEFK